MLPKGFPVVCELFAATEGGATDSMPYPLPPTTLTSALVFVVLSLM